MSVIRFPHPIRVPIQNHLTGETCILIRAEELQPTPATLQRITAICNEPEVYQWLFHDPLKGEPYLEAKARQWLESAKTGWQEQTHFIFAVLNARAEIVAACDIKSTDAIPEIGYWATRHHRGVMTNTVMALRSLATTAGFKGLFARAKIDNLKSQAVLQRVGFHLISSDDPLRHYFELRLAP